MKQFICKQVLVDLPNGFKWMVQVSDRNSDFKPVTPITFYETLEECEARRQQELTNASEESGDQ